MEALLVIVILAAITLMLIAAGLSMVQDSGALYAVSLFLGIAIVALTLTMYEIQKNSVEESIETQCDEAGGVWVNDLCIKGEVIDIKE